jgi:hypothetical protein
MVDTSLVYSHYAFLRDAATDSTVTIFYAAATDDVFEAQLYSIADQVYYQFNCDIGPRLIE